MKILLVESDPALRDIQACSLRRYGYEVTTTPHGLLALQLCQSLPPDIVLLDVGWSDPVGLDMLYRLRQSSTVPVIALTSLDDEDHIAECFRLGVDDVLILPSSVQQVDQRLRLLSLRHQIGLRPPYLKPG